MNARDFFDQHSHHEVRRVAILAGSSYDYLYQVAHGYRRPSPELAERLEKASDGRMDRVSLLWPGWVRPAGEIDPTLNPAARLEPAELEKAADEGLELRREIERRMASTHADDWR